MNGINCMAPAANPDIGKDVKAHVNSYKPYPTAAGLASSAAGYAALVHLVCKVGMTTGQDISNLAA